ncbi:MAG: EamA family transporter, partial [Rubrivivax sp.]
MSVSSSSLSSAARAANRRGILAMMLSAVSFVANDAMLKYASQSMAGAQAIFLRGLFAVLFLLVLAHAMGATPHWRRMGNRRVMARSTLDAVATLVYLTALFHLPLGNATAINMAAPLFIILFAVLALREHVTPARWLALGGGFTGVLLIVQPAADGFNAWAILSVCGTLLH